MFALTFLIQHSIGGSSYCDEAGKRKVIQIGKEETKLSFAAGNVIFHI